MRAAARLVTRNMDQFQRELESDDKARVKAGQTSAKVEGFRLHKVLKKELRSGAPGGRRLQPLRRISTGGRKRNPMSRFAKAVRYRASEAVGNFAVQIGFLNWRVPGESKNPDGTPYMRLSRRASGTNWIKKADMHQRGFSFSADKRSPIGSTYRQLFRRIGSSYGKRSLIRRFFFLKKSTKDLVVPARPMIDPFWTAHQLEASRNIISNFKRKMQGERI